MSQAENLYEVIKAFWKAGYRESLHVRFGVGAQAQFLGLHHYSLRVRPVAILFSLVASCKANQVEPFAYLRSLFRELPRLGSDSDELLPDRYLASHPEHRPWQIDELRAEERKRSRELRIRSR